MDTTTTDLHPPAPRPGGQRNAPGVDARLAQSVDVLTAAAEDARATGLHDIATTLFSYRDSIASLALELWKREGCER